MKNFTCPNCKSSASLRDIVPNKKLREDIVWFKTLAADSTTLNLQHKPNPPPVQPVSNPMPAPQNPLPMNPPRFPISGFMPQVIPGMFNSGMNPQNFPHMIQPAQTLQHMHGTNPPNGHSSQAANSLFNDTEQKPVKLDIDDIKEHAEKEMTPEEKMQLFNTMNDKASDGNRKQSSDKAEDSSQTQEVNKDKDKDKDKEGAVVSNQPGFVKPVPGMMPNMYPYNMMKPMDPSMMYMASNLYLYILGFDPRMYYMMQANPYQMGMYQMAVPTEEKPVKT